MSQLRDKGYIISDPLKWQEEMDNAPAGINLKGSSRFWNTVRTKLQRAITRDGSPECSEIAIDLDGEVSLVLSVEDNWPYINYRFGDSKKIFK
jgi:hypothetical protein